MGYAYRSRGQKIGRILTYIILTPVVLAIFAYILIQLFYRLPYTPYYENSAAEFDIPGIREGFVPQGFDYDEENSLFIVSGYMNEKAPSPVYILDRSGSIKKRLTLLTDKGEAYTGHSGGIAVHGDYVYLAGGRSGYFYVYDYSDLLTAYDGDAVACLGKFSTKKSADDYIAVSFIADSDTHLWIGEFYDKDGYETAESHKMYTWGSEYHQALAVTFAFDENAEFGISPTPDAAYSIPDKVQGMAFNGGDILLSTSRGFASSYIYIYGTDVMYYEHSYNVLETEVKLFALDSRALVGKIMAPPMAEEIAVVDGRLYIMNEFASDKYLLGRLTGADKCYSTLLSKYR